ncbi:P-loop containing nucleoside triphosphate hydrolase protein, partial [Mycena leptocephala]
RDDINWRSPQQGELVERMLRRQRHTIGAVTCDFGKSTVVMMIAKMFESHLVTIVILPLSGLHRDFHRRAHDHGLAFSQWHPTKGSFNSSVSLVYVSVEHAVLHAFFKYAMLLADTKRLSRVVIDEAQLLVTSAHYREPMAKIIRMLLLRTHVTLLLGTLPPNLLPALSQITGIFSCDVVRMASSRPNLRYGVNIVSPDNTLDHPAETYLHAAVAYIRRRVEHDYGDDDRAMIFCRTKKSAYRVAELLGVSAYTSETPEKDRDGIFANWTTGIQKIMPTTGILGAGVD